MSRLSKLKELFNTGRTTELRSESLKSYRETFNSKGNRYAGVYARGGSLYFTGSGEYDRVGRTRWYPVFTISADSEPHVLGSAVFDALAGFTLGIKYGEVRTGDIFDRELLKLSGLDSISKFHSKARYCGISQNKDDRIITFGAFKRGRGGSYSGLDFESEAPETDLEAIVSALDAAISASIG